MAVVPTAMLAGGSNAGNALGLDGSTGRNAVSAMGVAVSSILSALGKDSSNDREDIRRRVQHPVCHAVLTGMG